VYILPVEKEGGSLPGSGGKTFAGYTEGKAVEEGGDFRMPLP